MATNPEITVRIINEASSSLTSGLASSIASELERVLSKKESAMRSTPEMQSLKNLPDQMAIIAQSFKTMGEHQDQSEQKLYAQFKQAEASYLVNSPDYKYGTRGQQEARKIYEESGLKLYKTFDDFSKNFDKASEQSRLFSENVKLANRELSANNSSISRSKMNAFNLSELLIAAAARAATGYFTAGAALDQSMVGISAGSVSSLRVSTDIAQRNAISSAIQAGLPAIGLAVGGLAGAAIGYAASLPVSMYMASRNAQEQAQLNTQQQSSMVNLFGGGNIGKNTIANTQGIGGGSYSANSRIADLVNNKLGYLTSSYSANAIAFNKYRLDQSGIDNNFLKVFNSYIAQTGQDPATAAQNLALIISKSGASPMQALMSVINTGSVVGSDISGMASMLATSTSLGTVQKAQSFLEATTPYGPAFQQTAIGYKGMGFQQQMTMDVLGQAFNVNMAGVAAGHEPDIKQFKHVMGGLSKEHITKNTTEADIIGQLLSGGPTSYYSIMNAPNVSQGTPATHNITSAQVLSNAPAAYQQAVNIQAGTVIIKGNSKFAQATNAYLSAGIN